jgi:hypothetical protein
MGPAALDAHIDSERPAGYPSRVRTSNPTAAALVAQTHSPVLRQRRRISGMETILKSFGSPDAVREFDKGRLELVTIAGQTLGRATYQPGWRWSEHVGPAVSARRCAVEHLGIVLAGHAVAAFDDGRVFDLTPGTIFHIPPEEHDSWVVGDVPYVSLHLLGAAAYAT